MSAAERDIGYKPLVTYAEAARITGEYYRQLDPATKMQL